MATKRFFSGLINDVRIYNRAVKPYHKFTEYLISRAWQLEILSAIFYVKKNVIPSVRGFRLKDKQCSQK
jgi:hypothetical protein